MTQLDHLEDRIRFGRLQFHKKINITVGNIQIHNRQKIFIINFHNQQVFVGQMEHFLILMKAKGSIKDDKGSFFTISDSIQQICKIQNILNIFPNEETRKIQITGHFQDCKQSDYKLILQQTQQNKLIISVEVPQKYKRIYMLFNHNQTNQYYGLGQQFSYLNLGKNRPYSTFTRQKGLGRGQQPLTFFTNILHGAGGSYYTSYAPMPIWSTSKRVGYILNSYDYMAWMNNKILVWNNKFSITYIRGNNYKSLVKQIAQINGYTKPIPDWVNQGAILGLQGGSETVLKKYQSLKQQGAAITGVWIQDWVSKRQSLGYSRLWWNWQLDNVVYNNWEHFSSKLKSQSVQILLYINPMLTDASQKPNLSTNYYKIAKDNGYFVKLKNGQNYQTHAVSHFQASLIDFKNEKAVQFFASLVKIALNTTGAKGMMVDFAQAYPAQNIVNSIEQGAALHNQYPTLYHQKVNQIITSIFGNQNDFYIFTRAGNKNSPKYASSLWAGDQAMNFNFHTGLQSCLTAILSSGLVGYSNTHCDIGCYYHIKNDHFTFTQRSQILMVRSMQLAAFTSVFRTHEGNIPNQTLQVYSNNFLIKSFAFYSNLFKSIASYRKAFIEKSRLQKLPLIRPLFLQLQGVQGTQNIQDQFFLGSDIFVAPYLNQQFQRKYFLPKGEWNDIWSGKIYKGCDCERIWKEVLPPVFIRSSSQFSSSLLRQVRELVKNYKEIIQKIPTKNNQEL